MSQRNGSARGGPRSRPPTTSSSSIERKAAKLRATNDAESVPPSGATLPPTPGGAVSSSSSSSSSSPLALSVSEHGVRIVPGVLDGRLPPDLERPMQYFEKVEVVSRRTEDLSRADGSVAMRVEMRDCTDMGRIAEREYDLRLLDDYVVVRAYDGFEVHWPVGTLLDLADPRDERRPAPWETARDVAPPEFLERRAQRRHDHRHPKRASRSSDRRAQARSPHHPERRDGVGTRSPSPPPRPSTSSSSTESSPRDRPRHAHRPSYRRDSRPPTTRRQHESRRRRGPDWRHDRPTMSFGGNDGDTAGGGGGDEVAEFVPTVGYAPFDDAHMRHAEAHRERMAAAAAAAVDRSHPQMHDYAPSFASELTAPASPVYSATSPTYPPASPSHSGGGGASPSYYPSSPSYSAASPSSHSYRATATMTTPPPYDLASDVLPPAASYAPVSPTYAPSSPTYAPSSPPPYYPASPSYAPDRAPSVDSTSRA